MAESTLRRDGSDTLVYVADTAPTAVDDETDAAYDILGLLISNSSDATAATTDAVDKRGATNLRSNSVLETAQMVCHLSRDDDDGQVVVDAAMESGAEIYVLEMPTTVGLKGRSYTAIISGRSTVSANADGEKVTYTLGLHGTPGLRDQGLTMREIPWEDDALSLGPESDPVTVRYSFGNVADYDRAAAARGLPQLWGGLRSFSVEAAALFLLHFAETDGGARRFATFEGAVDGLRAVGFVEVGAAFVKVFDRSAEEFGLVPKADADAEAGAEGKG